MVLLDSSRPDVELSALFYFICLIEASSESKCETPDVLVSVADADVHCAYAAGPGLRHKHAASLCR